MGHAGHYSFDLWRAHWETPAPIWIRFRLMRLINISNHMVWVLCRRIQCLSSDRDLSHLHACVAEVEHHRHLMDHGIVTIDLDACLRLLDDRCIVSPKGYSIVRTRILKSIRVRFIRRPLVGVPLDRDARRCYALF